MNSSHGIREEKSSIISQLMMPVRGLGLEFWGSPSILSAKSSALLAVMFLCMVQMSTSAEATQNFRAGWVTGETTGNHNTLYRPGPFLDYHGSQNPRGYEIVYEYDGTGEVPSQTGVFAVCCGHREDTELSVWEQKYTYADRDNIDTDFYNPRGGDNRFGHGTIITPTVLANMTENLIPLDHPIRAKNYVNYGHTNYYAITENLKYGHWLFNQYVIRNCGNLHRANDGNCRFVKFIPNDEALAGLQAGESVRSVIHYWDKEFQNRHLVVRITKTENGDMTWTDGREGRIEGLGEDGEYHDLNGEMRIDAPFPRIFKYEATEEKGAESINFEGSNFAIRDEVEEFSGTEIGIGDNFKYGTWWIERGVDNPSFVFRPKTAIDELTSNETVTSRLVVILGSNDSIGDFVESSRMEITTTITGTEIPKISIAESGVSVYETVNGNSLVNIVLESDIMPVGGIKIKYSARNLGHNYLDISNGLLSGTDYEFSSSVTFNEIEGSYLSVLQIETLPGSKDYQSNGSIHVQLEDGIGYNVATGSAKKSSITIEMRDKRKPEISIRTEKTVLIEGEDALTVIFESDIARHDINLNIYYSVSQGDHDFINAADTTSGKFVVLEEGGISVRTSLSIGIIDDQTAEPEGEVMVTLQNDPVAPENYDISLRNTIVFTVKDNDPIVDPVTPPTDAITFTWDAGSSGDVSFADEFSIPSHLVGLIADNVSTGRIYAATKEERFNASGTKMGTFIENQTAPLADYTPLYRDFVNDISFLGFHPPDTSYGANEFRMGENFDFGVWYLKSPTDARPCVVESCSTIMFVPNADNLLTLGVGESVRSTYRYIIAGNVEEITVRFTRAASASSEKPIVWIEAPAFTDTANQTRFTVRAVRPETQTPAQIPVLVDVEWMSGPMCDRETSELPYTIAATSSSRVSDIFVFSRTDEDVCHSMIATIKPSISYTIDSNAHSVRIIEDSEALGIYVSADRSSIAEGGSVKFSLSSATWNDTGEDIQQDVAVTWKPAGLVTQVCGQNLDYFESSVTCSGTNGLVLGSLATSSSNSKNITVVTSSTVLDGVTGTITATLIGDEPDCCAYHPDKYTVSVVVLEGAVNRPQLSQANLSAFTQLAGTLGSRSLNTAARRVEQAFSEDSGISLELGGNSTIDELLHAGFESMDEGLQSWQEVFGNSSFEIGLFPEEGAGSLATVWGLGDYRPLSDNGKLDGNVFTGYFGFDAPVGEGMIAGLSTSVALSELDYEIGDDLIAYRTRTTGLHPYVGLESETGGRLHLIAGYGSGETELKQEGFETEILDSSYMNFGAGGEMKLYSSENILSGGTSELSIHGESWMVRQLVNGRSNVVNNMRVNVRHLRISAVGTHEHDLDHGATLTPEISFGLREDGMKRQSFLGIEIGSGFGYSSNHGYSTYGRGEMLLSDVNRIQEWGLAGNLSYDSFGDRLGVQFEFTPAWGQVAANKESVLWGHSILSHEFDSEMYTDGTKIDTEAGYGIRVWDTGVLTPYGTVALTQNDGDEFSIGSRLQFGSDFEFELEGIRSNLSNGTVEDEVRIDSSIKW